MATDGWYPSARINAAPSDAGTHLGPVTVGVLHTTESDTFTPRANDYFGHQNYPHFTVAVSSGLFQVWQHISIRRCAKAMENDAGGVQTNREGCIQIEIVGRAGSPFTNSPTMVKGLQGLMRWIESQTEIPASSSVTFWAGKYGQDVPHRLSHAAWTAYKGWLGHQHVPENAHYDPGAINIGLLLPGGKLKEIEMFLVDDPNSNAQWVCDTHTRRQSSSWDECLALEAMGVYWWKEVPETIGRRNALLQQRKIVAQVAA